MTHVNTNISTITVITGHPYSVLAQKYTSDTLIIKINFRKIPILM